MTVVFPSSHSPLSTSIGEHLSASGTPPPVVEASVINEDNHGLSSADESPRTSSNFYNSPDKPSIAQTTNRKPKAIEAHVVVRDDSICKDFLDRHLRPAPTSFCVSKEMSAYVDGICMAGTSEPKMYKPAASLLTAISKEVYKSLDNQQETAHRNRQHIRSKRPGHLTFINHHASAPVHFPSGLLSDVTDAPDLLGVYDVDIFEDNKGPHGVYKGVPHHRVEAIVEAKSETNGGGRRQAITYAYRHHQARPDRPGFYVLLLKPQWYQVFYSDPTSVFASPQTPWTNMDLLAAYIYSHYNPPSDHLLWDETIRWYESDESCFSPSWNIDLGGQEYTNGEIIFAGEPWSGLTTTFDVEDANGNHIIIKDYYRRDRLRFTEEAILEHLHAEGDLPGVVRLKDYETSIGFALNGPSDETRRVRFAFSDSGSRLLKAKTVNDLLKATYDALEVHRTKLVHRNVLHRDMSVYNILMYPIWGSIDGRQANPNSPPTVQDVLSRQNRPVEDRFPACLTIDYDNAAMLDYKAAEPRELRHRTGTPMYISRSVCTGQVLTDYENRIFQPTPVLSEEARELYVSAHGEERYTRYNDTKFTRHGACPPDNDDFESPRAFCHRPEHDVESVYWSMVTTLLHVRPEGAEEEPEGAQAFAANWHNLLTHIIHDNPSIYTDPRDLTLKQTEQAWRAQFLGDMKDVGTLLFRISRQIRPEYALFGDDLRQDHLHEAVQRLILQYLTDHDDIPLDPSYLRAIPQPQSPTVTRPSKRTATRDSGAGSTGVKRTTRSSAQAAKNASMGSGTKRKSTTRSRAAQSDGNAGPSTSRSRAPKAIVVDPKRKSSSQTGRGSKRLRNNSGLPQSVEER